MIQNDYYSKFMEVVFGISVFPLFSLHVRPSLFYAIDLFLNVCPGTRKDYLTLIISVLNGLAPYNKTFLQNHWQIVIKGVELHK